jgi:uncharacterized protein YraI
MHKHLNELPVPPQTWRADLPESIRKVLDQTLAKNPRDRFPSAKDFAQAFADAVRDSGTETEATGFFTEPLPDKVAPNPSPLLTGTPMPDYLPRSNTPDSGVPVQSEPSAVHSPTPYSTPPQMTPPPTAANQGGSVQPAPSGDAMPLTDPTATMMSSHTPHPADAPFASTTPPPPAPALDQAQAISPLPPPENVVLPPNPVTNPMSATPPPGYVHALTPTGQPIFVPQQTAAESPTAVMGPPPKTNNPMPWVLASVVVIVLGLLGLGALIVYNQGKQSEAEMTQAAALAAILAVTDTSTPSFTPSPTATLTFTPTPSFTPTVTSSPTPATPVVRAINPVSARLGPGTDYPEIAMLEADNQLDLVGMSEDGAWYQVILPDGTRGWIVSSTSLVNVFGNLDLIEIMQPPTETPSFTPTATRTPTATATRTPSPSPSATRTLSPSPTATRTPTPTITSTRRPSLTPKPTLTSDSSSTPTPRATPTRAVTATRTPRPTVTP